MNFKEWLSRSHSVPPKTLPGFPNAKRIKSKSQRKRWRNDDGDILEWDYQHGRIERYNKNGQHKGEFDPNTGNQTKPTDSGRTITPTIIYMNTQAYCLCWFAKSGEIMIGEENINCTPEDVRKWFELPNSDPACYCYDVTPAQVPILQEHVKHIINLQQHDYSLDCYNPSYDK